MRTPLPLLGAVMAVALVFVGATAASADDTDPAGLAWSVATVDGEHGTARPNFAYAVEPGTVLTDTMRVTNTGATALDLAVYATDAYTTADGNVGLLTNDEPPVDAGAWVTASTTTLRLDPGQQSDITFTVTVPADAAPGDHSAGIVTSFVSGDPGSTLAVDRRLGTRISVRVAGELTPAADVTNLTTTYAAGWNPFESGQLVLAYEITNTGNTLLTGTDASTAAALFGVVSGTPAPLVLPEVLPGSTMEVSRVIPIAPWGWVTGSVTVHPEAVGYGSQALQPVVIDYTVAAVPWMLLIAFVVVIVIGLLVWWLVARRRRQVNSAV